MEHDFWHQRWQKGEIGFHEPEVNTALTTHFHSLGLPSAARIFVPLCGKTEDIDWLLMQGYSVVGAELSELAVDSLFARLALTPKKEKIGLLIRYTAEVNNQELTVWKGDIFQVTFELLGGIDAVYDRAALVALPESMRSDYIAHVCDITQFAKQLLVTYEYDESVFSGPPFSISREYVHNQYPQPLRATLLSDASVDDGLKARLPEARKVCWLLEAKSSL